MLEYKAPFILPWVVLNKDMSPDQPESFVPFVSGPEGDALNPLSHLIKKHYFASHHCIAGALPSEQGEQWCGAILSVSWCGAGAILMVCTRENAPGVKEASVLDLSAISDDLPKPESSSSGVPPQMAPLSTAVTNVHEKLTDYCPVRDFGNQPVVFSAVSEADGAASEKKAAAEDDQDIVADLPSKPTLKSASIVLINRLMFAQ